LALGNKETAVVKQLPVDNSSIKDSRKSNKSMLARDDEGVVVVFGF